MQSLLLLVTLAATTAILTSAALDYSGSDMRIAGSLVQAKLTASATAASGGTDSEWLTACADGLDLPTRDAVCRQLGYTSWSKVYVDKPSTQATSGDIIMNLNCPSGSSATSLADCTFTTTSNISQCSQQLSISCTSADPYLLRIEPASYQLLVRTSAAAEYRAVCDSSAITDGYNGTSATASNLCRMLGRPNNAAALFRLGSRGGVTTNIAIGNIRCTNSASNSLANCVYDTISSSSSSSSSSTTTCNSRTLIGLYCSASTFAPGTANGAHPPSNQLPPPSPNGVDVGGGYYARLDSGGSPDAGAGRVLLRRDGNSKWGSVCAATSSSSAQTVANTLCRLLKFTDVKGDAGYALHTLPFADFKPMDHIIQDITCPTTSSAQAAASITQCSFTVGSSFSSSNNESTSSSSASASSCNSDFFIRCAPTETIRSGNYYMRLTASGMLETNYVNAYTGLLPTCGLQSDGTNLLSGTTAAKQTANALCVLLGFGGGVAIQPPSGTATITSWSQLTRISCPSYASSVTSCAYSNSQTASGCTNSDAIRLSCTPPTTIKSGSWQFQILPGSNVLLARPSFEGPSTKFGTVCREGMSFSTSTTGTPSMLCKLLGFETGAATYGYAPSKYDFTLRGVFCPANAKTFDDCSFTHGASSMSTCSSSETVMLTCSNGAKSPTVKSGSWFMRQDLTSGQLQIRDSSDSTRLYYSSVCDDSMGSSTTQLATADKLCNFLGYADGGTLFTVPSSLVPFNMYSTSKIIMRGVVCGSSAKTFADCTWRTGHSGCSISETVGLRCLGSFTGEAVNDTAAINYDAAGGGSTDYSSHVDAGRIVGIVLGSIFGLVVGVSVVSYFFARAEARENEEETENFSIGIGAIARGRASRRAAAAAAVAAAASSPRADYSAYQTPVTTGDPNPGQPAIGTTWPTAGFAPGFGASTATTGTGDDLAPPPQGYAMFGTSATGGGGMVPGFTSFGVSNVESQSSNINNGNDNSGTATFGSGYG